MDIVTLAAQPGLLDMQRALVSEWPEFMLHDPIGDLYYGRLERWREFALVAVVDGEVVGRAFSAPFAFGADVGRPELPPNGWEAIIRWSYWDDVEERSPTVVGGIEITVRSDRRGTGLAAKMIEAMRANADRLGYGELLIPVRPSRKHAEPATPLAEYAVRVRTDGLPADPWLRLHVQLGGEVLGICPTAMTISGSLQEWRDWTGLPFDRSGPVEVPGALVPVHVDVANDHAVYVEPNVWVRHRWVEPTG